MKKCKDCNIVKPLTEYYKNPSHADGLWHNCSTCARRKASLKAKEPRTIVSEKECNRCETTKNISEFYKNNRSKDGYRPRCKDCHNDDNARFGRATRYGMTEKQFTGLLELQKYCCKICNNKLEFYMDCKSRKKCLNVDHCHKTGRIRGILCSGCNRGLGAFSDSVIKLENAIKYLLTEPLDAFYVPSVRCHESEIG